MNPANLLKPERDVLIVDDAFDVRAMIKAIIRESYNFRIDEARDQKQALNFINKFNYQKIFLDIDLGKDDGLSILGQVKELQPKAQVIMISAHNTLDNVRSAVVKGADGFIVKPFSPQKIISFLES